MHVPLRSRSAVADIMCVETHYNILYRRCSMQAQSRWCRALKCWQAKVKQAAIICFIKLVVIHANFHTVMVLQLEAECCKNGSLAFAKLRGPLIEGT